MSAVDFGGDLETVMYVAAYMANIGLETRALDLFREVSAAAPHRYEPYVHGLKVAQELNDRDGLQWACVGILNQSWPKEQRDVAERAARAAQALVLELRQAGENDRAAELEKAIAQAQGRDVRIVVTWTGDADLDLLVEEPSGMVCSLRNQRTNGGGVLLGDTFAGGQGAGVSGYREIYECPQGFSGVYRLLLRRIWGKPTAGQATVDIYTHYGSLQEQRIHKQIPIADKDALVLFDLADGRRVEALEDAQIEHIAKAQFEVNRAIVNQQLAQTEGSSAARSGRRPRPPGAHRRVAHRARSQRGLPAGYYHAPGRHELPSHGGHFGRPALRADYRHAALFARRRRDHLQLRHRRPRRRRHGRQRRHSRRRGRRFAGKLTAHQTLRSRGNESESRTFKPAPTQTAVPGERRLAFLGWLNRSGKFTGCASR